MIEALRTSFTKAQSRRTGIQTHITVYININLLTCLCFGRIANASVFTNVLNDILTSSRLQLHTWSITSASTSTCTSPSTSTVTSAFTSIHSFLHSINIITLNTSLFTFIFAFIFVYSYRSQCYKVRLNGSRCGLRGAQGCSLQLAVRVCKSYSYSYRFSYLHTYIAAKASVFVRVSRS